MFVCFVLFSQTQSFLCFQIHRSVAVKFNFLTSFKDFSNEKIQSMVGSAFCMTEMIKLQQTERSQKFFTSWKSKKTCQADSRLVSLKGHRPWHWTLSIKLCLVGRQSCSNRHVKFFNLCRIFKFHIECHSRGTQRLELSTKVFVVV